MKINTTYDIGDLVYLVTDISQKERMVTAITVTVGGHIYVLSCGDDTTEHYEIEITPHKDIVKTLSSYDD